MLPADLLNASSPSAPLESFAPTLLKGSLADGSALATVPWFKSLPAAALFADISSFTPLAEQLSQQGPAGVEIISQLLNAYFDRLIRLITSQGGDIFHFAGDGLLGLWVASGTALSDRAIVVGGAGARTDGGETLSTATMRAVQCALEIQDKLHCYEIERGMPLSLRIGIGAGEVRAFSVGGIAGQWKLVAAGAPLTQMVVAQHEAEAGNVVLAPEAWPLVHRFCAGQPVSHGCTRVDRILDPLPSRPLAGVALPPNAQTVLGSYVPAHVVFHLDAGQSEWLAELRRVTILFLRVTGVDYASSHALEQTQSMTCAVQETLSRHEGSLRQIMVEGGETVVIAAFGLPPLSHADEPGRGVRAALDLQAKLRDLGLRTTAGITSGDVFCGLIGNGQRREYAIIGDVVNLACRLMQSSADAIRCDEATYQATKGSIKFEALPQIMVKGREQRVAVYSPQRDTPISSPTRDRLQKPQPQPSANIVGRTQERRLLADRLLALRDQGQGGVIVIEGDPGIGKSRLVEDAIEQARSLGIRVWRGDGSPLEQSTSYYVWRELFSQIFETCVSVEPEARQQYIEERLQREPNLEWLAPLLKAVLPFDWPDNEITEQLSGQARADSTRDVLVHLFECCATGTPGLLVLEDAHWLDWASWALAALISQRVRPLLLVIVARPMPEPLPAPYAQLVTDTSTQRLKIEALSSEDALELARRQLEVSTLPESVARFICSKAEGHPFFTEELSYALRDAGLIEIADGECRLTPGTRDLGTLEFPHTIQGVITGRIDRLTPAQQLTLKVASVVGHVFPFHIVRDIYPADADKANLAEHVATLERLGFTHQTATMPHLTYVFKHVITQEAAYGLMLFAQRRQLHCAVALWYEQNYAHDLASFYPLLAHHWSKAEVMDKALDYSEKAGEQALRAGAYHEAVDFLSQALRYDRHITGLKHDVPSGDIGISQRRARLERQLGEAHWGSGQFGESRQHYKQALALLGLPMPATPTGIILGLANESAHQFWHRLRPGQSVTTSNIDDQTLEWARVYGLMAQTCYYANEAAPSLYTTLRALNLAEHSGSSPELARFYAIIAVAMALVPLHPLAESYIQRALDVSQRIDYPTGLAHAQICWAMCRIGVGKLDEAENILEQALVIVRRINDRVQTRECLFLQADIVYYRGRFKEALRLFDEVYALARRDDSVQHQGWGLSGKAGALVRLGRLQEAATAAAQALALPALTADRSEEIKCYTTIALAHLRGGDQVAARQSIEEARILLAPASTPTSFYMLDAYAGAAEVYLSLWESQNDFSESASIAPRARTREFREAARWACKALRIYARIFPLGRPRAHLHDGMFSWLDGRRRQAFRAWRKGLEEARQLALPYEEGLALSAIGWHLEAGDPEKPECLTAARTLFTDLSCSYELERLPLS